MRYLILLVMLCLCVEATPPNLLRELGARRRAAGGEPWTPADLGDDLDIWYDASDLSTLFQDINMTVAVTSPDDRVRVMLDKSGNDRHAEAISDALRPIWQSTAFTVTNALRMNASPWMRFDNSWFDVSAGASFLVSIQNSGRMFTLSDNAVGSHRWYDWRSTFRTLRYGNEAEQSLGVTTGTHISSIWLNSSEAAYYVDGTEISTTATIYSGITERSGTIGASATNPRPSTTVNNAANGFFMELIVCGANISAANRQKIEGYLAHKWGLTANLPAEHPYKSSAPTK